MKTESEPCAVPNCASRPGVDVTFHSFPTVKSVREKWKVFCGIKIDGAIPNRYQVCSIHFTPDSFISEEGTIGTNLPSKKCIKKYAVPTLMKSISFEEIKMESISNDFDSIPSRPPLYNDRFPKCRVCLGSANEMVCIFDDDETRPNRLDKILQCAQIELGRDDGFPQNICDDCIILLDNAYKFKSICEQSDQFLKKSQIIADNLSVDHIKMEIECDIPDLSDNIKQQTRNPKNISYMGSVQDNEIHFESSDDNDAIIAESTDTPSQKNYKEIVVNDSKTFKEKPRKIRKKPPKNHQCDECGFLTVGPAALEDHKRFQHQGVFIYKCTECTKSFKNRILLKAHQEMVHIEDPVVCDLCGKSYKNKVLLYNHKRTHLVEKKFKCDHCSFQSIAKSDITKHQSIHTGERKFPCNVCDSTFRTSSMLSTHVKRVHDKLKRFKCDQCEKSFFCRYKLRKHSVVHSGVKPFVCPLCPTVSYSWYVGLTAHQRSSHPELKLETETVMYNKFMAERRN